MDRAYFCFCRLATAIFITYTLFPVPVKLFQERLAHDWLHSLLHLMSALFAAYAAWGTTRVLPAKIFTWGIGIVYLVLGVYGWFTPGMFLHSHFAIPLGVLDNLAHLGTGAFALTIAGLDITGWRLTSTTAVKYPGIVRILMMVDQKSGAPLRRPAAIVTAREY